MRGVSPAQHHHYIPGRSDMQPKMKTGAAGEPPPDSGSLLAGSIAFLGAFGFITGESMEVTLNGDILAAGFFCGHVASLPVDHYRLVLNAALNTAEIALDTSFAAQNIGIYFVCLAAVFRAVVLYHEPSPPANSYCRSDGAKYAKQKHRRVNRGCGSGANAAPVG